MKIVNDLQRRFSYVTSEQIGGMVEGLVGQAITQRRKHERRWYDNQFFDDGYHFRVISRKTGRVIDTIGKLTGFVERAIPRASLQIRGVSNLLFSTEPYPVVYPERITIEQFRNQMGQIDELRYKAAQDQAKELARKRGLFLTNKWEENSLDIKLIDMILLAAKGAVSYLQVYTDPVTKKICYEVNDSFDIILYGDRRSLGECPYVCKARSYPIDEVRNNPIFDPVMVEKLQPDNKYATSEIKDAYMRGRFGTKMGEKEQATIIVKEMYMKEVLTDDNWKHVIKLTENDSNVMDGKSKGDMVMRHPFSAGGVTLLDEYVDYDDYPFAYFRFEPGYLYQTPLIERFIPQNKSVDIIMTRLEKWVNSMVVGIYQKRKGENMQISNFPGGQVVEYEGTPLAQMQTASVGGTPFQLLQFLDKYIEEQGSTTAALGQIPSGVKSGNAIESLKASEYANLKIATKMLKACIKKIADLTNERADKDIMEKEEVAYMEDGEPAYFDVIGQRGLELSQQVGKFVSNETVPISRKARVRIEIEPGLGLTMEGKRLAMKDILAFLTPFVEGGFVNGEALKIAIKKMMETYGFGSTQEFMEALDEQGDNVTEDTLQKMKIAILEAMKDAGAVGPEADQKLVDSTKLGVLETLKESGVLDKLQNKQTPQSLDKGPSKSIAFKDLPVDGQVQLAQQAGIQLNPQDVAKKQMDEKAFAMAQKKASVKPSSTTS